MRPKEQARQRIDVLLAQAGWQVQDYNAFNLSASSGVAIREFPLTSGTADYLLFANRKAVGVIEAKSVGTTLSGVADQSEKYTTGLPANVPHVQEPLPFAYESTGEETFFRDLRDPEPCSRRMFAFHRPETLSEWVLQGDTFRTRPRSMPPLRTNALWCCHVEALQALETSLRETGRTELRLMVNATRKTCVTACSPPVRLQPAASFQSFRAGRYPRVIPIQSVRFAGKSTLRKPMHRPGGLRNRFTDEIQGLPFPGPVPHNDADTNIVDPAELP